MNKILLTYQTYEWVKWSDNENRFFYFTLCLTGLASLHVVHTTDPLLSRELDQAVVTSSESDGANRYVPGVRFTAGPPGVNVNSVLDGDILFIADSVIPRTIIIFGLFLYGTVVIGADYPLDFP